LIYTGEFFKHFNISLFRWGIGFFAALLVAIPLGIVMGWFRKFEEIADPLVQACRNCSVLALYPIFILLFGIGEKAKISIIMWGTVWVVLLNTIVGVKNVDRILVKAAKSMGIDDFELLFKVLLPAALPYIITGVRLGAASSILVLIAAEMVGANAGLGFMIFYYEARYAVPEMYGGIIILSVIGVSLNTLLFHLEKKFTVWREDISKG
jgi:NitT/TauT family transport system permease protein